MEPQRHAWDRPFNHGSQVECIALFSLYPSEEVSVVYERDKAIAEEVHKLQDVEFIRKVYYPDWLANVVMVKKDNGKWRMCVDFTDLTAKHQLLSFLDAFSSYNQIKLDEANQEKTSFVTRQGLFCYKVMLFGLKNASVTY